MPQHTGAHTHIRFDDRLLEQVNSLKDHYGIKGNAELFRLLVNEKLRQIKSVEATV